MSSARSKYININFLTIFGALLGICSHCSTVLAESETPSIEVADRLVVGKGTQTTLLLSGPANHYYVLALSDEANLLSVSRHFLDVPESATIIGSGQFDKSGQVQIDFKWPDDLSPTLYLQLATSKRINFNKDVSLSATKGIHDLKNLVAKYGIVGPVGPAGPPGPVGPVGEAGPRGADGQAGSAGPQGEVGAMGPRGPKGDTGEAGPVGPQGLQGEKGDPGAAQRVVMWSGGCSQPQQNVGVWNTYCLDSSDFNTAGDYLEMIPSGTMRVKKAGFYRINFWTAANTQSVPYMKIFVNGVSRVYNWTQSNGLWINLNQDITWPFDVDDSVTIQIYNQGGYGGPGYASDRWLPENALSRLQVHYIGPLP